MLKQLRDINIKLQGLNDLLEANQLTKIEFIRYQRKFINQINEITNKYIVYNEQMDDLKNDLDLLNFQYKTLQVDTAHYDCNHKQIIQDIKELERRLTIC